MKRDGGGGRSARAGTQIPADRVRCDSDAPPDLAQGEFIRLEAPDCVNLAGRKRTADPAPIKRSGDLRNAEDRLGNDGEPSLWAPHPRLPPPECPFVDPDEPGELLPGEALRLARSMETPAKRPAGGVRTVAQESDDLREEPDLGLGPAVLPTINGGLADALCNGKILLPEAS